MKRFLVLLIFSVFGLAAVRAQDSVVLQEEDENKIFDVVEQMPEYPEGMAGLLKFISNNLMKPTDITKKTRPMPESASSIREQTKLTAMLLNVIRLPTALSKCTNMWRICWDIMPRARMKFQRRSIFIVFDTKTENLPV